MKEHRILHISDIVPYENNPRDNDRAVPAVMESIRQCTYINDIIVDEANVILAGHTRYKALIQLGYTEVEVCLVTGLTEEQKRKYRLLDNKTGELAEWDMEKLEKELDGLDFGDFDFGFADDGAADPDAVIEDEPTEIDTEHPTFTQRGDIYLLGRHRLMCGDSTSAEDMDALMADNQANLLLTDPPYNVDYHSENGKSLLNDHMQEEAFHSFLLDALMLAQARMAEGAAFYIWHADGSEGRTFRMACEEAGLPVHQCLIWVKNSFTMGRQDYQWQHEPCLYGWKPGAAHYFTDDRNLSTVIDDSVDVTKLKKEELQEMLLSLLKATPSTVIYENKPVRNDLHPTMKPVRLMAKLMSHSSRKDDIVLDIFAGSGSTLMACEQMDRRGFMMELDERCVDVIVKRYIALIGNAEQVFLNRDGRKTPLPDDWISGA